MPARPIRPKVTDPKVAAEQAALRARALAMETGSLMKAHTAVDNMSPRSSEASSKPSRKVSFQEHDETIGGVQLHEDESTSPPTPPRSSENDEQLPTAAELAAAKKQAELKATLHAKLTESLKERKQLAEEAARLMADFQERRARRMEEEEVRRQSWDTCPDNYRTVVDENGERIKRPAFKALMKSLADGTFRGIGPSVPPEALQASEISALPPTTGQQKASKPEKEIPQEEHMTKEKPGMSSGVPGRKIATGQLTQHVIRTPIMLPANSNFVRPSATTALQTAKSNPRQNHLASPLNSGTRTTMFDTTMALAPRENGNENRRPSHMSASSPSAPTIRFDAPIEAYERWAAQNFRG